MGEDEDEDDAGDGKRRSTHTSSDAPPMNSGTSAVSPRRET